MTAVGWLTGGRGLLGDDICIAQEVTRSADREPKERLSWTLTLVPVPVSDVDRARTFYTEQVGFHLDHDAQVGGSMRFVQLTPPGSRCSIVIGTAECKIETIQGNAHRRRAHPDPERMLAERATGSVLAGIWKSGL